MKNKVDFAIRLLRSISTNKGLVEIPLSLRVMVHVFFFMATASY